MTVTVWTETPYMESQLCGMAITTALSIAEMDQRDSMYIDSRYIIARARLTLLEQDYIEYGGERYIMNGIVADNEFFKIFRYEPAQGNLSLDAPDAALLTEEFAARIFGSENPIGRKLRYANGKDVVVSGVLRLPDCKRTLDFDIVLSSALSNAWERMPMEFVHIESKAAVEAANAMGRVSRYINPHALQYDTRKYTFSLIPVKEIYWSQALMSNAAPYSGNSGNRMQLYVFIGMCVMIFLAGVINFVNLYMVVMSKRGRFHTLRKVFGAGKKALFMQIYAENALLIIPALFVAWLIIEITNVPVNNILGTELSYSWFDLWISVGFILLLPLIVTVYFYYRCQKEMPILSLRTLGNTFTGSMNSRMTFLFVQYLLTFILIMLAFNFNSQLRFMLNTPPGFETKDIIHAELVYEPRDYNYYTPENIQLRLQHVKAIDKALNECPDIRSWTASPYYIIGFSYYMGFTNNKDQTVSAMPYMVTPQFFDIYRLKFIEGGLPENIDGQVCLLTKSAMKAFGYTSTDGATVFCNLINDTPIPVVGVINDYYSGHISSGPASTVFIISDKDRGDRYEIACREGKAKEVIEYLRQIQKDVYGVESFKYSMLEDKVKDLYRNDEKLANVYLLFSGIAVFIVCLGLFGISLYDIRRRYREIAIRKVNGARMKDLYLLLGRKYTATFLLSFIIATPVSWYIISVYSANFVVKAPVGISVFLLSFLLVAFVSLVTIVFQLNKAVRINPSDVMKSE